MQNKDKLNRARRAPWKSATNFLKIFIIFYFLFLNISRNDMVRNLQEMANFEILICDMPTFDARTA